MVERVIHQTYKSLEEIPAVWQKSHQCWKEFAEKFGFEYRFWSDEDLDQLIIDHYPQHLQLYNGYRNKIQQVDFARYAILHRHGGLYVDLDLSVKDQARFCNLWLMFSNFNVTLGEAESSFTNFVGKKFTNALMMGSKNCKFFSEVMKKAYNPHEKWCFKTVLDNLHHFEVINSTGPGLLDESVKAYPGEIGTFPKALTAPGRVWYEKPFTTSDAVLEVLPGSSWCNENEKYLHQASRALDQNWLVPGILLFIIFLLLFRGRRRS
jgi:mannosyltransferase OCH1-like enzyme